MSLTNLEFRINAIVCIHKMFIMTCSKYIFLHQNRPSIVCQWTETTDLIGQCYSEIVIC